MSLNQYAVARRRMVQEQLIARGIKDEKILELMLKIPRHLFVDEGLVPMAYNDHPLSIGEGQTISQPYIVAYMIGCLDLKPGDTVLEIGTGCGYVTALLAEMVKQVYSVERIPNLFFRARAVLKKLGYRNIHLRLGDGTQGWAAYAPYDAILVSAAGPKIPEPYREQLAEGGRLILPVGGEDAQELRRVTRHGERWTEETLTGCRFVKLKGRYGFQET